ncbi:MAG: DNA modification methylase [Bacteroidales bacterium]|nr:DNA modification methylase [Bacteroidales bacterium]
MATYKPEELRAIFRNKFDKSQWITLLRELFNATELRVTPELITDFDSVDKGYYLGNIETTDYFRIGLFHYEINAGSVANKRVGLRNLIKPFLRYEFDAALVVFDSSDHWRLSFICDIKEEATSPKRYTYVFGDKELLYRTPIDRFNLLQKKGISFENIKTAFSVEALSNEFFDRYREQYADFIQYVTGKRVVKSGSKWVEKEVSAPNVKFMQAFGNNEKRIRDYIKKMMGRITFLHFLQRKGWLNGDLNYMQNMFEQSRHKDNYLDAVLEPLFFGILNTKPSQRESVFEQLGWDKSLLNEWAEIPYLNGGLFERDAEDEPDSVFPAEYFARLFQFFSEYNFTIDENDPNDAEVGVDPEMLGKIFENLLEDNKDKGAFYTPKEIVRYMCQESLIAYLETNTSIATDKIRQFVLSPEEGAENIPEMKRPKLVKALEDVKICDPAIGSGAFPMGLLNELLRCREALSGEHYDRAEIKKSIIQNSIYGVDIEKGAVDIARLRFWLSIVVDEEKPLPLPNFDYKIMQGNSLIESFMGVDLSELTYERQSKNDSGAGSLFDDEKNRLQKVVSDLLREYYSCSDHDSKIRLQQRITNTINAQLEAQNYDPEILQQLRKINLTENNKFFLWHTWFSDVFNRKDGKKGFDIVIGNPPYVVVADVDKEHLYYKYKTKNCLELYSYFFEHSINILQHNGVLTFITGALYTKGIKFEPLRSFLENNSQLISYRNEGDEVFKNVNMPTSTILLYKSNIPNWSFDELLGNSNNILAKMNASSKPLSSISIMQRGFEVGRDRVSKVEGKYRFLTGSNVEKYCYKTISYVNQDVVTEFQKDAFFYTGERLLIRETGSYLTVVYLDENLYCNRSLYSTIIKDSTFNVQYVVGILNSKAIQYYYQQKFKAETELFPKIRIKQAKQLPIPVASLTEQQLIVALIEQIRTSKKMTPNNSIEKLEREIDKIVYQLYNLTDAEIKIIEESI